MAFITLLERKVLRYSQYRLGPNKVRIYGILQPIADAVKLFTNQYETLYSRNYMLYFLSPLIGVFLVLLLWSVEPLITNFHRFLYSIILILIIIRIGVYPLLLAGWSSNRKYSILGGLRGVSQTISYEIRLALILLILLIYLNRFSLENLVVNSFSVSIVILNPLLIIFWLVSCLAETNRTPFDFSEGESELVSGFNVEYGSGGFAVIFIAEYARIYFLRILSAFIIFGYNSREISRRIFIIILIFFWIWRRSTLPRFRYDFLINLAWKRILPLVLGLLEVSLFIVYI